MAKRTGSKTTAPQAAMSDYRHAAKRKNNPPAKIAAEGVVPAIPKAQYAYNPHLPPMLRFDTSGQSDHLPELLRAAQKRPLTPDETHELAAAIKNVQFPWLEWTGKRELPGFTVDPVALHIHDRISTQAILKVAARQDVEKSLFADPEMEYREAVQFYKHDVDWANRMILGDSLQVMSSLARREDLAGKVQMIYMDPPYGIKFASNFQPEVGRRDVKDKDQDLTREPEMVKAYRDTWHLGVHSYLTYLRDRLIVARELLADTGSIFVQISDENLHHVREIMDEVFGAENFCSLITFAKTTGQSSDLIPRTCDFLLWYARSRPFLRAKRMYYHRSPGEAGAIEFKFSELPGGEIKAFSESPGGRCFATGGIVSMGASTTGERQMTLGKAIRIDCGANRHWKASARGMERLWHAERILPRPGLRIYKRYFDDFPLAAIVSVWTDTRGEVDMLYAVQTTNKVIERCLLMTTDPGDLVLDPTCGSGTTAYVAEQWGRRWITIDTSRVAIAIARQRLLTAKFDFYKFKDPAQGTTGGFIYKTVPHITLKSIAQNTALDPIFAKHEPILEAKLAACNAALAKVSAELRKELEHKLLIKQQREGKKSVTDGDHRRWILPPENRDRSETARKRATVDLDVPTWYHWEVPFDADPDWPGDLQAAVTDYRRAWRAKMDEVNACIQASAGQEELVDQPEVVRNVVRVSGPFTVEAVQPPEMTLGDPAAMTEPEPEPGFAGSPETAGPTWQTRMVEPRPDMEVQNAAAYLHKMLALLKADGVRFPNNRQMAFTRLEPLFDSGAPDQIHAEGNWEPAADQRCSQTDQPVVAAVGVVFGPQYGPVTAKMVEEVIKPAARRYDDLVIAGFSFTAEAQAIIDENPHPKLKIHIAHIRPDINPGMDGLLKTQPGGQLFTVFGLPRVKVTGPDGKGEFTVMMEGVDIYNPVDNSINSTGADKVAAWFLDGDYDGRTFCITQAFFPDRDAWEKLSRALNGKNGVIDAARFEAFSGTISLPFPAGKHKRAAVKVIDPRGNEVMKVERLK
ncbi:MAG: site-specific DNA-methyltransferase [Planctomycetia bacterium]|nr:site-specific DNA-methyltransferase [Planctomycetia bacterium]